MGGKMVSSCLQGSSDTDNHVDDVIEECLNPESPQSFFLYAGAGSGKTYSLVKALETFEKKYGEYFRKEGKKIAVITYTNAACDEITERVKGDPLFHISTIHSFCWTQIQNFHDGIREWLRSTLPDDIAELEQQEKKGRPGTKTSAARQRSIASKTERYDWLLERREFIYNPNGDNLGKASLSHSEVIKVCSSFLIYKPTFQQIVVNRYPFMLIDESQDTNKQLIEALFEVEGLQRGRFGLGLIGDVMQRIYGDGKADLGLNLPEGWVNPIKEMNRRCPSRIVSLANDIREEFDQQKQKVLEGKPGGYARLFIAPVNKADKASFERSVKTQMAEITSDILWNTPEDVKHLMLEHMMAAVRMGFEGMFGALGSSPRFQTALRSGDLAATRLFSEYVFPLYKLEKAKSNHAVMTHLRKVKSPLLDPDFLQSMKGNSPLEPLRNAIDLLVELIDSKPDITFLSVLQCVAKSNLFTIPQSLVPFVDQLDEMEGEVNAEEEVEDASSNVDVLLRFLETTFRQIEAYKAYVSGDGAFDTHQGVKGKEFERVLVVMDDEEARGFLFSYEKLFEVKGPTRGDLERIAQGEETGIDRTRRLFYVTCTRAEKSLALVAYSQDPKLLKEKVISKGWFLADEVILEC